MLLGLRADPVPAAVRHACASRTSKACTNADGFAEVTLTTEGASGSLSVQVDGGAFEELTGTLLLGVGEHTIVVRDATGNESSPVEISIPPQLRRSAPAETTVDEAAGTYQVVFAVEGGTPPYVADPGTVVDTTYTSPVLPVAEVLTVMVKDAAGCTVEGRFESGVEPASSPATAWPIRQGYRFWLPEAREQLPINEYKAEVRSVRDHRTPTATAIDLTAEVNDIVNQAPDPIRTADFADVVQRWVDAINELVAGAVGSDQWFRLEYEAAPETGTTGTLFVDRLSVHRLRLRAHGRVRPGPAGAQSRARLRLAGHRRRPSRRRTRGSTSRRSAGRRPTSAGPTSRRCRSARAPTSSWRSGARARSPTWWC